ncbi:YbeD family protein [Salinibius halmophilus]|uniref:YbeD family protein n=1 Tax=Salinibius halmophilus TaxID=1853216 RepID=UPI000E6624A2|nr:DUF493 domain-containing protein [Salinibius halmophilus]
MSEVERPEITFPCPNYVIKVIGDTGEGYKEFVVATINELAKDFDANKIKVNPSKNGNFVSYSFTITAESKEQLSNINDVLRGDKRTRMVL